MIVELLIAIAVLGTVAVALSEIKDWYAQRKAANARISVGKLIRQAKQSDDVRYVAIAYDRHGNVVDHQAWEGTADEELEQQFRGRNEVYL